MKLLHIFRYEPSYAHVLIKCICLSISPILGLVFVLRLILIGICTGSAIVCIYLRASRSYSGLLSHFDLITVFSYSHYAK